VGYFSNGTEGDIYRAQWCERCANDGDGKHEIGCAVMDAHLFYNYDQFADDKLKGALEALIPREGIYNGQCRMFRLRELPQAAGAVDPQATDTGNPTTREAVSRA